MLQVSRAKSSLRRIAAVGALLVATIPASLSIAQEPQPQHWDAATAGTLLTYIQQIGSHGLDPGDYEPNQLRTAIDSGDAAALEKQATESFALIAEDLATGHVPPNQRERYYVAPNSLDPNLVARMIDMAITAHQTSWVLDSFAPQNPEYAELRSALAGPDAADPAKRQALRVALERWRWFPHNPGARYLFVNIPEYRLRMIENGKETDNHKVIVGKTTLPTPQFSTRVTGVIFNPPWNVPQSIIRESVGSLIRKSPATARNRGYTWTTIRGHLEVTQKPGPGNSLGQMKLDMPNPLSVYLHDTPSKSLFDKEDRTFSHGCMRMQDPFEFAAKLLANVGWNRARIDAVVSTKVTTRAGLKTPLPAYVVYMTAVPQPNGGIAYLKDPYKLDATVAARLN